MARETILVVDDEPAIVQVIRDRLEQEGYRVRTAGDGGSALAAVEEERPDLMLLDLMLPDLDGFEILRRLRGASGGAAAGSLPVIVLTARDDNVDVVVGLELGADDYVVKPFNPRELVARVRAVLRRRLEALALAGRVADLEARLAADPATSHGIEPAVGRPGGGVVEVGELTFDPPGRRAWFQGQLLDLRPREYDLLYFLARHSGQVLGRDALLDAVWGTAEFIDDRTVDVHVHRLRQKLVEIDPGADPIRTERGIGYCFEP
jgi:DNA-binding response OmpR family regulator